VCTVVRSLGCNNMMSRYIVIKAERAVAWGSYYTLRLLHFSTGWRAVHYFLLKNYTPTWLGSSFVQGCEGLISTLTCPARWLAPSTTF
jgi:hypothetical protein